MYSSTNKRKQRTRNISSTSTSNRQKKECLEDKVSSRGGRIGFGMDDDLVSHIRGRREVEEREAGLYGNRMTIMSSGSERNEPIQRIRLFQATTTTTTTTTTTSSLKVAGKNHANNRNRMLLLQRADSKGSGGGFSLSSRTPNNPYTKTASSRASSSSIRRAPSIQQLHHLPQQQNRPRRTPVSGRNTIAKASVHIVCAISENLARETCVASLDAGAPVTLHVTKQGNGQTYSETLSYLEVLKPDEILLNDGRRNSQLAQKILSMHQEQQNNNNNSNNENSVEDSETNNQIVQQNEYNKKSGRRRHRLFNNSNEERKNKAGGNHPTKHVDRTGACNTQTVVKFIPRSYFDQTKGAELLRRIAREDTYDSNVVDEYILLSSSHAVLQYTQLCLGANFTRSCLCLQVNCGGNNRMAIDRSTVLQLELLANAQTGKMCPSLIGTIDCTKTTVGSRLLRTNLMAPPIRKDTINTRLDLVDLFLEDEEFFYAVMDHLEALPDVDKMLTNIALVPWKKSKNNNGKGSSESQVTARIASKGISSLVCIKSILSAIPAFASTLEDQLTSIESRDRVAGQRQNHTRATSRQVGQMENDNGGGPSASDFNNDPNDDDAVSAFTKASSLLIGLGSGRAASGTMKQQRYQLLRAILLTMKQPALSEVLDAVTDIFTESTTFSRNAHAMRHQECFALKPNTDGMMDVLRKAFLANVDDIYRLADEYAESYEMTVAVKETTSRGYYLTVPIDVASELPEIFIQPVKSGKLIHCTTEEVHSLNARAQENVQDLLLMTHERIQEVLDEARLRYDALASLSDAIALLDMCHCFADNVASSRLPWARPVVSDGSTVLNNNSSGNPTQRAMPMGSGGDIAIRNGRYGINVNSGGTGPISNDASSTIESGTFIPNDTYASEYQNFTVITGVNGSGKSTYLKQIAIIVILAHCGSYIPAEEAFIPIRDRLLTRIGTADDQEHNISTFMLEMKETAFICNNASEKSLILVDELGRATSNEDGVAIAWAVSEYLLEKGAMAFFVTHYHQISKLAEVYPTVQNQHLGAKLSALPGDDDENEILYSHKIVPGPCRMSSDYGVEMATACGWPQDVVSEARLIREEVEKKLPEGSLCQTEPSESNMGNIAMQRKAEQILHKLSSHLTAFKESCEHLSPSARRCYLQEFRDRFVPNDDAQLVDCIKNILLDDGRDENPRAIQLHRENLDNHEITPPLNNKQTLGTLEADQQSAPLRMKPLSGEKRDFRPDGNLPSRRFTRVPSTREARMSVAATVSNNEQTSQFQNDNGARATFMSLGATTKPVGQSLNTQKEVSHSDLDRHASRHGRATKTTVSQLLSEAKNMLVTAHDNIEEKYSNSSMTKKSISSDSEESSSASSVDMEDQATRDDSTCSSSSGSNSSSGSGSSSSGVIVVADSNSGGQSIASSKMMPSSSSSSSSSTSSGDSTSDLSDDSGAE